jgi:hypothetical protein
MQRAVHPNVVGVKTVEFECKYPKKDGSVQVLHLV